MFYELWLRDELKKWSSHLLDNPSAIVSFVHVKNIRCPQWDSNPWSLPCRCSAPTNWAINPLRCEEVILLGSCVPCSHLSGFIAHDQLERALQRSGIRIPLKTPGIFQVQIWDNRWDSPASVRISSSIQLIRIIRSFKEAEKRKESLKEMTKQLLNDLCRLNKVRKTQNIAAEFLFL